MREIKIIANSQNKNEIFMSDANTLGELKAELINKGYEVEDMDFKEGKSRVTLKDDLSVLPSDFMYKGELTSDLVIMITKKNSKIESGMTNFRHNLYNKVREYELQNIIKSKYGKNFTQCKDVELEQTIDEYVDSLNEQIWEQQFEQDHANLETTVREIVNEELDKRESESEYNINSIARCLLCFIDYIYAKKLMSTTLHHKLRASILKNYEPYTKEEIEEMFN